jgi:NTE family protein
MTARSNRKGFAEARDIPFERVALVLQGGGALGAYQAGVYEALAEGGISPNWIAGVSIGAINAAIIAGNPPNTRVDRLREFWMQITSYAPWPAVDQARFDVMTDHSRNLFNFASANLALTHGARGFFSPRLISPFFQPSGTIAATSFYDTGELRRTLERLVDFDRLNSETTRVSVGAVNVRTGNFVYFDTTTHAIGPQHVMASGALPPALPAVEIEGEHYWDGGLVSNTPLQWVLDCEDSRDTLAFQVDLWNCRGDFPRDMAEVLTREKEILYSSRTRAGTDESERIQRLKYAVAGLLEKLPDDLRNTPEAKLLSTTADRAVYNIVHLIYRAKNHECHSKDYEFSRLSMEEHWRAGYFDAQHAMRHRGVLERPKGHEGVVTFDLGHS